MRIYLAYGSNLNKPWMKELTGKDLPLGKSELKDYKLAFAHGGYLNIEKTDKKSKVPVILWEVNEEAEKALDEYESYPELYRKENIEVELNGASIEAFVYIMNQPFSEERVRPTEKYLNMVKAGYKEWDFSEEALDRAIKEV